MSVAMHSMLPVHTPQIGSLLVFRKRRSSQCAAATAMPAGRGSSDPTFARRLALCAAALPQLHAVRTPG
eukprot:CAMPEP_0167809926 /NCGR_PEP_ID=MMETSP0111_2-20121227/24083_1 /TAXON_ID=91324 /ORGANISM="Lotharella globosa, Strain CCCM811" /LENGTH=68 /DNA_ID=CAMNT_0007708401 /DNA_START=46 /DNA_END=252 /DNA_ORIENTATION=-